MSSQRRIKRNRREHVTGARRNPRSKALAARLERNMQATMGAGLAVSHGRKQPVAKYKPPVVGIIRAILKRQQVRKLGKVLK